MSTLNSGDMNIERSSTRIKAPPGGSSSIFFGEYDASQQSSTSSSHSESRSRHAPRSTPGDFYGASYEPNPHQQQFSNRRDNKSQNSNSDIFGTNDSNQQNSARRRQGNVPQQNLDLFGQQSAPPQNSSRGPMQPKTDIFGQKETTPISPTSGRRTVNPRPNSDIFSQEQSCHAQNTGRRAIQQPNSSIFNDGQAQNSARRAIQQPDSSIFDNGNNQEPMNYTSRAQEDQRRAYEYEYQGNSQPAGAAVSASDGVFNTDTVDQTDITTSQRRRFVQEQGSNVFSTNEYNYEEPTSYQTSTSAYQQQPTGRGSNSQSLGSMLNAQVGSSSAYSNTNSTTGRPPTGNSANSSQMAMAMGQHEQPALNSSRRRQSNSGKSSLVLN